MKFSIVITTYNRLQFLQRAIESALNQTVDCEVVVVDDCSADGTEAYLKSLGNRVVYHRNSTNLGHSETVNIGIKIAAGEWIKLLDDDDYLVPECIEKLNSAISSCPNAAICSCQAIQVNENGLELSRTKYNGFGNVFYISQEDIHYGMLLDIVPFGTPVQVAFTREAFLKSGGWDSAFDGNCDDINSWIKIAKYGDAVFINDYLAYRTIWSGGCHKQLTLKQRLDTNYILKEQICNLISEKYASSLPTLKIIYLYLKLHWFLVGLKQKQPLEAIKVANKALFSLKAWFFLYNLRFSKKIPQQYLLTLQEKSLNFTNSKINSFEQLVS
jgi:glycosyltransferase involved in cell wall biosynthesis